MGRQDTIAAVLLAFSEVKQYSRSELLSTIFRGDTKLRHPADLSALVVPACGECIAGKRRSGKTTHEDTVRTRRQRLFAQALHAHLDWLSRLAELSHLFWSERAPDAVGGGEEGGGFGEHGIAYIGRRDAFECEIGSHCWREVKEWESGREFWREKLFIKW